MIYVDMQMRRKDNKKLSRDEDLPEVTLSIITF